MSAELKDEERSYLLMDSGVKLWVRFHYFGESSPSRGGLVYLRSAVDGPEIMLSNDMARDLVQLFAREKIT